MLHAIAAGTGSEAVEGRGEGTCPLTEPVDGRGEEIGEGPLATVL
jgi:hypothetical protein